MTWQAALVLAGFPCNVGSRGVRNRRFASDRRAHRVLLRSGRPDALPSRAGPCAVQVMGVRARLPDSVRVFFTLTQYRAPVAVPVLRHLQQQAAP